MAQSTKAVYEGTNDIWQITKGQDINKWYVAVAWGKPCTAICTHHQKERESEIVSRNHETLKRSNLGPHPE